MQEPTETTPKVVPGVDSSTLRPPTVIPKKRRELTLEDYIEGVTSGDRMILGRALSLVESIAPQHRQMARQLVEELLPFTGRSIRLGISGVPGVGKSTFIESFGMHAIESESYRVAVLAIDPSSEKTGGSILGDKTRMDRLASHPSAMVRPTATGSWLGGVARASRESILLCEAAGYNLVIVETVGVGQSETQVASMVDFFLLLMLPGAGDELQGIKRGILEVADAVAVNKADGAMKPAADVARAQLSAALRLLRGPAEGWSPKVLTCSALQGIGIPELWQQVKEHRAWAESTGTLEERRAEQSLYWMNQSLGHTLRERFEQHPEVRQLLEPLRNQVRQGSLSPFTAVETLINLVFKNTEHSSGEKS